MSTVQRIEEILAAAVRVPIRDAAGIITPAGIDVAARAKALRECLEIAKEEEEKDDPA